MNHCCHTAWLSWNSCPSPFASLPSCHRLIIHRKMDQTVNYPRQWAQIIPLCKICHHSDGKLTVTEILKRRRVLPSYPDVLVEICNRPTCEMIPLRSAFPFLLVCLCRILSAWRKGQQWDECWLGLGVLSSGFQFKQGQFIERWIIMVLTKDKQSLRFSSMSQSTEYNWFRPQFAEKVVT